MDRKATVVHPAFFPPFITLLAATTLGILFQPAAAAPTARFEAQPQPVGQVSSARRPDDAVATSARDSLAQVGDLIDRGRYGPARALANRAIERLRAGQPRDSLALAFAEDLLLQALARAGTKAQPEWFEIAREALSIRERCLGHEDLEIATSLNRLANLLADSARYEAAEPLYQRALTIREKGLGPDHPKVAEVLINLAILHRNTGDWSAAHPLYLRAMMILDRALGSQLPLLSQSVNSLVDGIWSSGEYGEARMLSERFLSIWERATGPDHPEIAMSLRAASGIMQGTGDWAGAWPFLEQALAMFETSYGSDHPDVALSYNSLAVIFMVTGQFTLARTLFERAIVVWERGLGPDHPDLALGLEYLAGLLARTGDLAEARQLYERALRIREKAFGPDDPLVAVSLDLLVGQMISMGDDQAARPLAERALAISERALGPSHPQVASEIATLAHFPLASGDLEGAKRLLQRQLEIVQKSIGPDQFETANALSGLARVEGVMGDHHAARALDERARLIKERLLGPAHPDVAEILQDEAEQSWLGGDPERAREMLTRVIAIQTNALGRDHPRLASSLTTLAMLLHSVGEDEAALDTAMRAERISRDHFRAMARVLPERQALALEEVRSGGLSVGLLLLPQIPQQDRKRRILDALVRSRALVLDEMAARHRSSSTSKSPEAERLMAALQSASARYAALLVRGPESAHPETYRSQLDREREEMERAERDVSENSAAFRQEQRERLIGISEVAGALPRGAALLGFAQYPQHLPNLPNVPARTYLAYVLRGGTDSVAVVQLGSRRTVDALVARWSEAAGRGVTKHSAARSETDYRRAGAALREKVWDPVTPYLQGADRVFVVPDGALNLVNLATLPLEGGSYLVEKGMVLHYLSAERDLVTLDSLEVEGRGLFAMGGPAYDESPATVLASSRSLDAGVGHLAVASDATLYRGGRSGCGDFATLRFDPLPGTLRELSEIGRLWGAKRKTRWSPAEGGALEAGPVVELTGVQAGERAFKQGAPGHAVLHLATHGFFINGKCRSVLDESGRDFERLAREPKQIPAAVMDENPLVLSGLALAGANHRNEAGREEEDGILTAEEIASLDLHGVQWAVLSACETGVGGVRAGEGVFGLRRAFQVAGVRTLIMSLWAVEDQSARAWMRALYEGRFQRGLGTAEAVREASLSLLRQRRTRGSSTHPFYWGAFVAAGNWR